MTAATVGPDVDGNGSQARSGLGGELTNSPFFLPPQDPTPGPVLPRRRGSAFLGFTAQEELTELLKMGNI